VRYALTPVEVPHEGRQYYAGPIREISGRMAHKVTPLLDRATIFNTAEEAEALRKELGSDYRVIPVDVELTASVVDALVDAQLAAITDPAVLPFVARLRVAPRQEVRTWDYGEPHEYPCWIVVEHRPSNTAIAYCAQGFGPRAPWGLLFLTGRRSMGMDSGWFSSLEEAMRDSFAMEDLQTAHDP
jgi:hypothetical protein